MNPMVGLYASATEAIETIVLKYQAAGIKTELVTLNEESQAQVDRLVRRIA